MEKAWLSQQNIPFEERDVIKDPKAMNELLKLDVYSTPVTLVDGEIVVGFDQERLKALLEL